MAEKSLKVSYVGDASQLQRTMGQVAKSNETLSSQFTKLAGAVGVAFSVGAVVAFGKEILTAANEAERSTKALQAAAKGTSVDVAALSKDFEDWGLAAAIDDETLKDLASQLLRMGFKGSTSELAAEVQAIEDLGAATGKSTTKIEQFFVALNTGNVGKAITSAKTLGLVTQQQADRYTRLVKAGKAAEVQQDLLTAAQTKGHGAAEDQATDLDKLVNRWNEFKETLGTQLLGNLEKAAADIERIALALRPVIGLMEQAKGAGGGMSEMFVKFLNSINPVIEKLWALYQAVKPLLPQEISVTAATHELTQAERDLIGVVTEAPSAFDTQRTAMKEAQKQQKEWAKATIEAFTSVDLSVSAVKDTFTLTSAAAVKATDQMAKAQTRIATDLRRLDALPIGENLRNQLEALGPEMVDAFVRGSPKQRAAIKAHLKVYDDEVKATTQRVKAEAHTGGEAVGTSLDTGMIAGITSHSPQIAEAARQAVLDAIAAAREAAAAQSPSKKMAELGRDLMLGLAEGVIRNKDTVEAALDKLVQAARDRVAKIRDAMNEFKDSIRAGFTGFKDLFGGIGGLFGQTDEAGNPIAVTADAIKAQIAAQVAQARELSKLLRDLAKQGLSKQLLSQLAGQGAAGIAEGQALLANPELIAQLNAAQAGIQQATNNAANPLGGQFFGDRLQGARQELNVTINVAGTVTAERELAETVRRLLIDIANRNGGNLFGTAVA